MSAKTEAMRRWPDSFEQYWGAGEPANTRHAFEQGAEWQRAADAERIATTVDERAALIAQIRWLADARAEYLHGLDLSNVKDYFAADAGNRSLWDGVSNARLLADILEGSNDAKGWLPSWMWAEWEALSPVTPESETN